MGRIIRPRRKEDLVSILKQKTYATFDGGERGKGLPGLCLDLLSEQKKTWPDLRRGCEALRKIRERDVPCQGFSVRLQHNPERIKNTLADIAITNADEGRCFLCLEHLPERQKGVLYRREYLILCNPRPIFPAHFTVSHIEHRRRPSRKRSQLFSGWLLNSVPAGRSSTTDPNAALPHRTTFIFR